MSVDPHAKGYRLDANMPAGVDGGVRPSTVRQWRFDERIRQLRAAPDAVTLDDLREVARLVFGAEWSAWTRDRGPKTARTIALELVRDSQPDALDDGRSLRALVRLALTEAAHARPA